MKKLLFFLLPLILIFTSCKDVKTTETIPSPNGTFTLQLTNLPALPDSLVLAAWIMDETGKVIHNFGKLSYPAGAATFTGSFQVTLSEFQQNTKNQFVCVSVEDRDSVLNDSTSSNVFVLISKIRNNSSTLSVVPKKISDIAFGSDFDDQKYVGSDTSSAIPPSFGTATAKYTVFTPTDNNPNTNSGLWFLNYVSAGVYNKGLRIPELPSGWAYKGWVVVNGKYLPLGSFTNAVGDDAQNLYVGSNPLPGYPGEDFLQHDTIGVTFPTNLAGQEVMISLEPIGYNFYDKSKPFPLILFKGTIPSTVTNTGSQTLQNNYSSFPTGTAVYNINIY